MAMASDIKHFGHARWSEVAALLGPALFLFAAFVLLQDSVSGQRSVRVSGVCFSENRRFDAQLRKDRV